MFKLLAPMDTLRVLLEMLRRIPKNSTVKPAELRQQLEKAGDERDLRTIQHI